MDQRTRKLMMIHKTLHRRDDIVSRKGGKGIASIEDSLDPLIQQLDNCIEKCGGRLITTSRNNTDNMRINQMEITRKQKWEKKTQLFGHFKQLTIDISYEKTWT